MDTYDMEQKEKILNKRKKWRESGKEEEKQKLGKEKKKEQNQKRKTFPMFQDLAINSDL